MTKGVALLFDIVNPFVGHGVRRRPTNLCGLLSQAAGSARLRAAHSPRRQDAANGGVRIACGMAYDFPAGQQGGAPGGQNRTAAEGRGFFGPCGGPPAGGRLRCRGRRLAANH